MTYLSLTPHVIIRRGANFAVGPINLRTNITGWTAENPPDTVTLTVYSEDANDIETKWADIDITPAEWAGDTFVAIGRVDDTNALPDPDQPQFLGQQFKYELSAEDNGGNIWALGGNKLTLDNLVKGHAVGIPTGSSLQQMVEQAVADAVVPPTIFSDLMLTLANDEESLAIGRTATVNISRLSKITQVSAYLKTIGATGASVEIKLAGTTIDTLSILAGELTQTLVLDPPLTAAAWAELEATITADGTDAAGLRLICLRELA